MGREIQKEKVAAYCRVSTLNDSQDGSFEVQCDYYEKLIKGNPDMVFVGIYGDHGKSGREMRGRSELNRLIRDCEAGIIDVVLTKSISRFARNMLECVKTVRYLSDLGVTIRFEKEGIDTSSMGGELMLGILATIAQEESNAISMNMTWSRINHLEKGQPWEKAGYGYISTGPEHRWEVVEQEADVVKKAFYMAGMCYTYSEITDEMNRMEKEQATDRIWKNPALVYMLRNEIYLGNYLSNKEIRIVDRNGISKRVRNHGQRDQILIEEHHDALVSKELFYVVQELLDLSVLGSVRVKFSSRERSVMKKAMRIAAEEMLRRVRRIL